MQLELSDRPRPRTNGEPIHVAGRRLDRVRHLCAFFHIKDEEYNALLDFIREGLERNAKAFHLADANYREQHAAA